MIALTGFLALDGPDRFYFAGLVAISFWLGVRSLKHVIAEVESQPEQFTEPLPAARERRTRLWVVGFMVVTMGIGLALMVTLGWLGGAIYIALMVVLPGIVQLLAGVRANRM